MALGGRSVITTGAMLLLERVSTEEARRVFDLDPFVKNQVFVVDDIWEWTAPEAGAQPYTHALLLTGAPEVAHRFKGGRCLSFRRRSRALAAAHFGAARRTSFRSR
jgi:hypothetical protein